MKTLSEYVDNAKGAFVSEAVIKGEPMPSSDAEMNAICSKNPLWKSIAKQADKAGYKLIEAVKEINNVTYGFCPECGNSYSMAPPEAIKEEVKEPKFYRVREGKAIMGFCTGVSKYTGIPLLWVRIMGVFYGITLVGIALYFLISICVPFEEDVNGEQ